MGIEFELMDWEGGCDVSGGKWRVGVSSVADLIKGVGEVG